MSGANELNDTQHCDACDGTGEPANRRDPATPFREWWETLTGPQGAFLRHKARWEQQSMSAVSVEWGAGCSGCGHQGRTGVFTDEEMRP